MRRLGFRMTKDKLRWKMQFQLSRPRDSCFARMWEDSSRKLGSCLTSLLVYSKRCPTIKSLLPKEGLRSRALARTAVKNKKPPRIHRKLAEGPHRRGPANPTGIIIGYGIWAHFVKAHWVPKVRRPLLARSSGDELPGAGTKWWFH